MTQISGLGAENSVNIGAINNSANYNSVKIRINNPQTNVPEGLRKSEDNGIYNAVDIEVNDPSVNVLKDKTYDYPMADEIVTYEQAYIMPIEIPALPASYQTEDAEEIEEVEETEETEEVPEPNFTTIEDEKADMPEELIEDADIIEEVVLDNNTDGISFHGLNFKASPEVQIVPDSNIKSQVNINETLENLTSSDFDTQALEMEKITKAAMESSKSAIPYITSDVFIELSEIANFDSSELEPPSEEKIAIRQQIIVNRAFAEKQISEGKKPEEIELLYEISEDDLKLASELSPMEKAERNKTYALLTLAGLTTAYANEFKSQTGNTVPLTDLPGVSTMVEVLKDTKNPEVKVAALFALAYVCQPEYKDEIKSIIKIASNDNDKMVAQTATAILERLE